MLSSCRGDDGDEVVLSLLKLSRAVGCSHFRQILQSRSSQTWAAGGSYCPIFQAGLSVSFLSGVGCRRFILPHISGRPVSLFPLRCGLQAVHTAPYFRQVCQSRSSQVWAAGGSYCPIFQAGLSVSFLSDLGCRRFILPHISGRSVSLVPLRLGLQANLTAPYFRQVCQLSLVHSS